jgi:hypothetical protein
MCAMGFCMMAHLLPCRSHSATCCLPASSTGGSVKWVACYCKLSGPSRSDGIAAQHSSYTGHVPERGVLQRLPFDHKSVCSVLIAHQSNCAVCAHVQMSSQLSYCPAGVASFETTCDRYATCKFQSPCAVLCCRPVDLSGLIVLHAAGRRYKVGPGDASCTCLLNVSRGRSPTNPADSVTRTQHSHGTRKARRCTDGSHKRIRCSYRHEACSCRPSHVQAAPRHCADLLAQEAPGPGAAV